MMKNMSRIPGVGRKMKGKKRGGRVTPKQANLN
jgi:hypothetical protein